MKTKLFLLAAAATLASCSSSDDAPNYYDGTIRLTTTDMSVNTRGIDQDIQSTQFLNGETVDIFLWDAANTGYSTEPGTPAAFTFYTQPLVCTADGSGGLSFVTPQYWPIQEHPLTIYGVYPSGAVGSTPIGTADMNIDFTVQSDQSTAADYKASDLMVGMPTSGVDTDNPTVAASCAYDENVPLTFKHMLSKININLSKTTATTEITDEQLKSAKVSLLNIKPTAHFSPKKATALAAEADGTAGPVVLYDGTSEPNPAQPKPTYSGIVPPQTFAAATQFIKIEVGADTFVYSIPAGGLTLEGKKVYTFDIKIHKATIILTTTITDWVDGTPNPTEGNALLQ